MKPDVRTPAERVLAVRVTADLATTIEEKARADDRTVSGYLRRLLSASLRPDPDASERER